MKNIFKCNVEGMFFPRSKELLFTAALAFSTFNCEAYSPSDHIQVLGLKLEYGNKTIDLKMSFANCAKIIKDAWKNKNEPSFLCFANKTSLRTETINNIGLQVGLVLSYLAWAYFNDQIQIDKIDDINESIEICSKEFGFKVSDTLIDNIEWYLFNEKLEVASWLFGVKHDRGTDVTKHIEIFKKILCDDAID